MMPASFFARARASFLDACALMLWIVSIALIHPWNDSVPPLIRLLLWFGPVLFAEPLYLRFLGATPGQGLASGSSVLANRLPSGGYWLAPGMDPDITLAWVGPTTLESSAPSDLPLEPEPASRRLDHHVQCRDHLVQVIVRRR